MSIDHGIVTVDLDGEVYELRPTLKAARKINQKFGGLRNALAVLLDLNFEHIAVVIAAGAGVTGKKELEALELQVFYNLTAAAEQVAPFLEALLDPTGKRKEEKEGKSEKGE